MSVDFERDLIAYLAGDGPESFEEDLFAAAARGGPDGEALGAHVAIHDGLFELESRGVLDNFITREAVEQIRSSTTRTVEFQDMGSGGALADVRPSDETDVFISRWVLGDLSTAVSIDLESYIGGELVKTILELDFDPADDSIYMCCSGTLARQAYDLLSGLIASGAGEWCVRFVARDRAGSTRAIAEYRRGPPSPE